jgi:ABC-type bacteriocin/lantibiotic exporter with double-glycine peptidase domain
MPLDEREQRILEEIERRFYEQDPKLAQTVATTTIDSERRRRNKWAVLGAVVGLFVMLLTFQSLTWVALAGFVVMVASISWMVPAIARRTKRGGADSRRPRGWSGERRERWRRDR